MSTFLDDFQYLWTWLRQQAMPSGIVFYAYTPGSGSSITANAQWEKIMASVTITDAQQVPVTVQAVDARGNPTTSFPSAPAWSVSDPTILSVAADPTGLSAVVAAVGALGTAQVTVSASLGGASVTGVLSVSVVADAATTLSIVPGTPVAEPAATPTPGT